MRILNETGTLIFVLLGVLCSRAIFLDFVCYKRYNILQHYCNKCADILLPFPMLHIQKHVLFVIMFFYRSCMSGVFYIQSYCDKYVVIYCCVMCAMISCYDHTAVCVLWYNIAVSNVLCYTINVLYVLPHYYAVIYYCFLCVMIYYYSAT